MSALCFNQDPSSPSCGNLPHPSSGHCCLGLKVEERRTEASEQPEEGPTEDTPPYPMHYSLFSLHTWREAWGKNKEKNSFSGLVEKSSGSVLASQLPVLGLIPGATWSPEHHWLQPRALPGVVLETPQNCRGWSRHSWHCRTALK